MPASEKQTVIKAIDTLGRRVTVADVSTKTGLSLATTSQSLNQIASETGGNLQVADSGDLVYRFNPGFQTTYLTKGIARIIEKVGQKTFDIAYFCLRISFGIMLILSFLAVIGLILVVIMSGRGGRDNDRDRGGFDFSFFDWMIIRELFWWGTWSNTGYNTGYGYPSQYSGRYGNRQRGKSNFLMDCFSFLFGDGNPNAGIEERKWQTLAQVIKSNKGVVTCEQLAPYTGANPKDEDAVLPVLVRFNGKPEVTDSGNIVYTFPELQVSAGFESFEPTATYLDERKWKFSNASIDALVPVMILAAFNFLGSWWLYTQLGTSIALAAFAPLVVALVIYGTMFVLVPTIRYLVLQNLNSRIASRNQNKLQSAKALDSPNKDLAKKLNESQSYAVSEKKIDHGQVIYTTEKDLLEQDFEP
jgi:hypothetical protein